jgi:hypothetical protein
MKAVSVPPIPTPLDDLGPRPFSFYPPILGIEHNEWLFQRATWSEVQVMNTKTNSELWVPRRFLGAVSSIEDPVMIVGLSKELAYKAGTLVPSERRVIQMPRATNHAPRSANAATEPERPAPVVGIRLEGGAEARAGRLLLGAVAAGILVCVGAIIIFRDGQMGARTRFSGVMQSDLPLTARDDYYSIVSRFGPPAEDRWQAQTGEMQYRRLWYPQQSLALILMGADRNNAHYIGAFDQTGRVVHSVDLAGGKSSAPLLKNLKKF